MRSFIGVLPCIALSVLAWGNYGPLMHHGQSGMGESRLRPFIGVGLAYFLIAVVVPIIVLRSKGEKGSWTLSGMIWSLSAGAVGAIGALGIILALSYRGNPVYVMPLVFGCAPVVNTFVTMFMSRTFKEASGIFYAGVLLVALGAAGVLVFKPAKPHDAKDTVTVTENGDKVTFTRGEIETSMPKEKLMTDPELAADRRDYRKFAPLSYYERMMIPLSIIATALCWGSYGPVLHTGQMKMQGSRLRPFLCVGLSYFVIAVVVPLAMLAAWNEPGGWTMTGMFWSLGAGAAGAFGALGIIMAFNFGGKPIFVMPLVFGGAPVINTFTSVYEQGAWGQISPTFFASLGLVIAGAVTVLVFAPKPGHKPAAKDEPKPADVIRERREPVEPSDEDAAAAAAHEE